MQGTHKSSTLNLRIPIWTFANNAKASLNAESLTVPAPGLDLSLSLSLPIYIYICYLIFKKMNRSKSKKGSWLVSAVSLLLFNLLILMI